MVPLDKVFESLERAIEIENQLRRTDELGEDELIRKTEIRIMGQMSLLTNDAVKAQIKLLGTLDVDAAVDGYSFNSPYSLIPIYENVLGKTRSTLRTLRMKNDSI